MSVKEYQKRAAAKYNKNNTKTYSVKLNRNTDADIMDFLDAIENRNMYIKTLIREDMERCREGN